ncbi:thioredoxin domain-containing protein [Hyphomonas oceanitis]|uniref:thioredoxin domain-containing protein n=1 Tax=Hyphomonas oceanitis TaxID=81033 RepID=UPI00300322E0
MRERLLTIILVTLACALPAAADPTIKVINFTATWCPVCRMLDPRLHDAVERFEDRGAILVNLDQTHLTRRDDTGNAALMEHLHQLTASHNVAYLWDWYGGHAGIAVIVAADNGEPLTCITSALATDQIADLLQESVILATRVSAGARRPKGTNCPPRMNARASADPMP